MHEHIHEHMHEQKTGIMGMEIRNARKLRLTVDAGLVLHRVLLCTTTALFGNLLIQQGKLHRLCQRHDARLKLVMIGNLSVHTNVSMSHLGMHGLCQLGLKTCLGLLSNTARLTQMQYLQVRNTTDKVSSSDVI